MRVAPLVGVLAWGGLAPSVHGAGATRALPDGYVPGVTLTVSIAIDPPPDPVTAALEDAPPSGWSVSNISDGGIWDAQQQKVKWGIFFDPSIPGQVSYDVTPPGDETGDRCFAGTVSFGSTGDQPITGDDCLSIAIPALSTWGMAVMALLLLAAGGMVIRGRRAGRGLTCDPANPH